MEILNEYIEQNKELVETIRFLIEDEAFSKDFILTTVLEYIERNKPKDNVKHK